VSSNAVIEDDVDQLDDSVNDQLLDLNLDSICS